MTQADQFPYTEVQQNRRFFNLLCKIVHFYDYLIGDCPFLQVLLTVAVASVALAVANPIDVESIEPTETKEVESAEAETSVRDKRTLLLGAAPYVAPLAYSAYAAPLAYSGYSAPYTSYPVSYSAYSAYSAYPYYASPYYVV